jgi:Zn-dependent peptidase ImmA (M78 family)
VPIVKLTSFAAEFPESVRHLTSIEPGAFSAATVPLPNNRRVIVHNDTHSRVRQRANISHELAHIILEHPFTLPIDSTGFRSFDRDTEDEANWLGPVILITNEAALHIVREGMDERTACAIYEVSSAVLRMRINSSGARIRVERRYGYN